MKEDIIKEFTSLKGVGESEAEALYEAGYESIEELADATVEELSEVKEITPALAKGIKDLVSSETVTIAEDKTDEEIIEVPTAELEMDPESLRLLKVRKKQKLKKPHFVQTDYHKKKRLKDTWRKPKGLHNKKRRYILGKGEMARPGYGSPTAVKGLHPSGFIEVLLNRVQDVDNVNPNKQAIRIARTVGQRKRLDIVKKARSLGLKIVNPPLEKGDE
ncbi:MAG: 50S ribosomal protein L32e [Methanosarcinales archaeon]|nr:50S ribosomal protein L32e [Methanosarcinales archaeon]